MTEPGLRSSVPPIQAVVLDIDGVLTDGQVVLNETGGETKVLFLRDLDAITRPREEGLRLALVTDEDSALAEVVARRLGIETVLKGAKDRTSGDGARGEYANTWPGVIRPILDWIVEFEPEREFDPSE